LYLFYPLGSYRQFSAQAHSLFTMRGYAVNCCYPSANGVSDLNAIESQPACSHYPYRLSCLDSGMSNQSMPGRCHCVHRDGRHFIGQFFREWKQVVLPYFNVVGQPSMLLETDAARVRANSFLTSPAPATSSTGIVEVAGYTLARM
jgi:hypothetical protein